MLAWCKVLFAQDQGCTLTLEGRVVDAHDGGPLAFAEVRIASLGRTVQANEDGAYRIAGLCPGTYLLQVAHIGCGTVEQRITIDKDERRDLRLEHHEHELKQVEVLRARPDEDVGHARDGLDREGMEKAAGRTLAEMLAGMPGVTVLQTGPTIGKPVIHGLSGNRVLTLNQGVRQEDQQWGTEHAPTIDPLSSDRITVVKGAAAVQYGSEAMGGVVVTEPVDLPREAGLGGEVRLLGVSNGMGGGASGTLQGGVTGVRGLGWRVQGSGRYLGDSEAPDYVLSNTGVREAGLSSAAGYADHRWDLDAFYSRFVRELGILRASHIGNLTDLNNAIDSQEPWYVAERTYAIGAPRQTVDHHLVKAEVARAVGERGRLQATYAYQADSRQEYDVRRGGRSDTPAIDLFLATHTGELVFKHWLGGKVHGRAGANVLHQLNENVPGTGVRPLIPNYRKRTAGLFVLEHVPIDDRLELEAGARAEATDLYVAMYTANDVLVVDEPVFRNGAVSAGFNWSVRDSTRLRFNVSSAFRPPNIAELYSSGLHHGSAAIEEGDPALGSERSLKAVLDLEHAPTASALQVHATVHASRNNSFIYLRPTGVRLTVRGAFPVYSHVATDAAIWGGDLLVTWRMTARWSSTLKGSTVRARDLVQDEWLFGMPADRMEATVLPCSPSAAIRWAWT
jgi:iron complex outermembrane receptor protein